MSLKHITVSPENYLALKKLGDAGDSFNDVISEILKGVKETKIKEDILDKWSDIVLRNIRIVMENMLTKNTTTVKSVFALVIKQKKGLDPD